MPTVSFSSRAKTALISLHMSKERCLIEEGFNLFPLQCRLSVENFPAKATILLSIRSSKILDDVNFRIRVLALHHSYSVLSDSVLIV